MCGNAALRTSESTQRGREGHSVRGSAVLSTNAVAGPTAMICSALCPSCTSRSGQGKRRRPSTGRLRRLQATWRPSSGRPASISRQSAARCVRGEGPKGQNAPRCVRGEGPKGQSAARCVRGEGPKGQSAARCVGGEGPGRDAWAFPVIVSLVRVTLPHSQPCARSCPPFSSLLASSPPMTLSSFPFPPAGRPCCRSCAISCPGSCCPRTTLPTNSLPHSTGEVSMGGRGSYLGGPERGGSAHRLFFPCCKHLESTLASTPAATPSTRTSAPSTRAMPSRSCAWLRTWFRSTASPSPRRPSGAACRPSPRGSSRVERHSSLRQPSWWSRWGEKILPFISPPKLPTHHHGNGGGEAHQFPQQAPILALTLTPPDASPQATVPALTDLAAQNPAAKDGLATLLQQLMATKTPDPLAMSLVRGGAS